MKKIILLLIACNLLLATSFAQNSCQCWIPRDTSFRVVPFTASEGAPLYRNDDGSSPLMPLAFNFCFWGTNETALYINNNGNISFSAAFSAFTAFTFPLNSFDMLAPFWADVDTENPASGVVWYKQTSTYLIVQWDSVGYYSSHADKRNTFQCILSNGSDPIIPYGNNVQFCYKTMQWTTGGASSGVNGFDNSVASRAHPATVGANKGDGVNYIQVGLFGIPGFSYLGQFPAFPYDGISWLDNQSFYLNTCSSSNNLLPITSGNSACDTIRLCVGDSISLPLAFLSSSPYDTIHTGFTPSIPGITILNANTDSMKIDIVANSGNIGIHNVTVYGYNNATPPDTSFSAFVLKIDSNAIGTIVAAKDSLCQGDSTTIKISNAITDSYVWSTGQSIDSIEVKPLVTTTYTCTLTKGSCGGLQLIKTIYVGSTPVPNVTSALVCNSTTGYATSTPTGGVSPYTFLWSDVNAQTTATATGLSIGVYTVSVSDHCGNSANGFISVTIPGALSASANATSNVHCYGGTNGIASANVTGGTIPYSYLWSDINSQTSASATGLSAGTYTVTVTDNCNNTSTASATITQPAVLNVVATATDSTICSGLCTDIYANTSGGTVPYTYLWSNGNTSSTQNICPVTTTPYLVGVTDSNSCLSSGAVTINVNICTGLDELQFNNSINVYPNPTNDILNIQMPQPLDGTLSITTIVGQQVCTGKMNNRSTITQVSMGSLSQGVYLLKIESAQQTVVKRIVKL